MVGSWYFCRKKRNLYGGDWELTTETLSRVLTLSSEVLLRSVYFSTRFLGPFFSVRLRWESSQLSRSRFSKGAFQAVGIEGRERGALRASLQSPSIFSIRTKFLQAHEVLFCIRCRVCLCLRQCWCQSDEYRGGRWCLTVKPADQECV